MVKLIRFKLNTIIMSKQETKLIGFLKEQYKFPSTNLNEIKNFIDNDCEMKNLIYNLPKIITQELEHPQISLDFMKESNRDEKILEISVFTNLDEQTLLQKEDLLGDKIINKYPNTENQYIILLEPNP